MAERVERWKNHIWPVAISETAIKLLYDHPETIDEIIDAERAAWAAERDRLKAINADLLVVLKRLVDEAEEALLMKFGDGPPDDRLEDQPAFLEARAAIAKAKL